MVCGVSGGPVGLASIFIKNGTEVSPFIHQSRPPLRASRREAVVPGVLANVAEQHRDPLDLFEQDIRDPE